MSLPRSLVRKTAPLLLAIAALAALAPLSPLAAQHARRICATALGGGLGALAGAVASPLVGAINESSEQPDAALWMAGVGSVFGATVSGARCRGG